MIRRPLLLLCALLGDALHERIRLRFPRVWPWALVLLTGCGMPAPKLGIGHCGATEVEAQRAAFLAAVIPAVTACAAAGAPEDCIAADEATQRWLDARKMCR